MDFVGQLKCPAAIKHWTVLSKLNPPIPDSLFNHDFDRCYCSACESPRQRRDNKGSIPVGYTRFGIYVEANFAEMRGIFSTWPKGFHGTKHSSVSSIVQTSYLVCPGGTTASGVVLGIRDGHIKKTGIMRDVEWDSIRSGRVGVVTEVRCTDNKFYSNFDPTTCVFLSNHFGYVEHPIYAETADILGIKTTILIEFRIQPNSYDEATHTVSSDTLDSIYRNEFTKPESTWEWFTNRYGVMKVTGVLVKAAGYIPYSKLNQIPPSVPLTIEQMFNSEPRKKFLDFLACPTAFLRYQILLQSGVMKSIFNEGFCLCYCKKCRANTSQVFKRGNQTYRLPYGFTRFALQVDEKRASVDGVFTDWPVVYHGTTFHNFKNIIHSGIIVPAGARGPGGMVVGSRDAGKIRAGRMMIVKPVASEDNIFVSPLLSYASNEVHASSTKIRLFGMEYMVSVVFQLRIRPGSYSEGPSTLVNYTVPKEEIEYTGSEEWFTKRHGCLVPYGILLKTEPVK